MNSKVSTQIFTRQIPLEEANPWQTLFSRTCPYPKLSEVQKGKCEENLTVSECFNTLKSFQKNKTSGNDGLTVEFYLAFCLFSENI